MMLFLITVLSKRSFYTKYFIFPNSKNVESTVSDNII